MSSADKQRIRSPETALERQRHQLETGDPALQLGLQPYDLIMSQIKSDLIQEIRRLVRQELQILSPKLQQLTSGAVAGQRQRRLGPSRQHEVEGWRQVVEQEC